MQNENQKIIVSNFIFISDIKNDGCNNEGYNSDNWKDMYLKDIEYHKF